MIEQWNELQVRAALQPPTQGVVLRTYGAGNMPTRRTDIIEEIRKAIARGCIIVNCSQCIKGQVDIHYATGKVLNSSFIGFRAEKKFGNNINLSLPSVQHKVMSG